MGLVITAAVILVLCLIAAGLVKRAEPEGDVIALQNRLEASRDFQLQDDHGRFVADPAEDTTSEDFINREQHWNP